MGMPELTLVIFYAFNALRVCAYLPQILRVANDDSGAPTISYTTWSVWIGANGSTAAYALVIDPNWTLFTVNALNAIGCALVVALTALKRRQFATRHYGGGAHA
jgi:hypothetical protein